MRDEARRYGGGGIGGRLSGQSVVTWLLIANVAVFLWDGIFGEAMRGSFLAIGPWAYFSPEEAIVGGQVWRFLTYQFVHAGFMHILFNMIGLYFFGPLIEQWWGPKRFLVFYLLCGASGALVATLLGLVPGLGVFDRTTVLMGASGALFGILAGCAVLFPRQRVQLLFPPVPMTMRTMALVFLGIAAVSVLAGSQNAGGEAAHLGGALLGFVLAKNGGWLNWADRFSPEAISAGVNDGRHRRQVQKREATEAEVDRILAKVQAQGLQSLTKKEKRTLNQATEAKKRG